jgi:glycosyltransferase involved in cell wall biosynthesis
LLINGMTGYLDSQFRHLHRLGHEILLVAPGSPKVAVGAMRDTKFTVLDRADDYATVIAWPEQPEPADLVREVLAFNPDAVYMTAWNFSNAYRAVMKAVDPGVVRLMYMDNLWRATPRQWLGRATNRLYIRPVADAAVVASDRSEFYARRLGFGPGDVIRGGVVGDTDLFRSPPRVATELASRRAFLYVGRLVDHKGPDVLAAAYERYRELVDDPWDLHVVGMGPMADLLTDKPGVVMHGFIEPEGVAELMRRVSCFVLTSHIEPYGVAVHEAAASGLPILCTEFAGAAAVFVSDGQNGWQVPSGDIELWASAMVRMSKVSPDRLAAMSQVSLGLAGRLSPAGWALNISEEIERRRAAGGGRLTKVRYWAH